MTALSKYQRLEAPAIWRQSPDAQRLDVIVSFGDATLTITTGADLPVSHWSLAAIHRINPGRRPALYAPGPDEVEMLEITDPTMVGAIEKVQSAVARGGPHPARLRRLLMGTLALLLLALALFWLPSAMTRYASSIMPEAKRNEIGEDLLSRIEDLTGMRCTDPLGQQALADLSTRLMPDINRKMYVLPSGVQPTRHLPGGIILLNRSVVEDFDEAAAAAGFVISEDLLLRDQDPMVTMLDTLGLRASVRLLTTGMLTDEHLDAYAAHLMKSEPENAPTHEVLARFRATGISAKPYAFALDITGESSAALIAGDPVELANSAEVLPDSSWVSLQSICGE